jgi:uncharacterized membrane protein YhaH (DUF805 family)
MGDYFRVLRKFSVFDGRAERREYWMFSVLNLLIGVALLKLSPGFASLYVLAIILPTLAVTVRRLHDVGRSGRWLLISFIPIVGSLVLLALLAGASEPCANRYGANPHDLRRA